MASVNINVRIVKLLYMRLRKVDIADVLAFKYVCFHGGPCLMQKILGADLFKKTIRIL